MEIFDAISKSLKIQRGSEETIQHWHERLAYSAAGYVGVLSLYDDLENQETSGEPISITHFKRRVIRELKALCAAGNISEFEKNGKKYIAEEIYRLYLTLGNLYRAPRKIDSVPYRGAKAGDILFLRGVPVNRTVRMSGIGFYRKMQEESIESECQIINFNEMFHISALSLDQWYAKITDSTPWKNYRHQGKIEYLRIAPPFTRGYWKEKPDRNGKISILRIGEKERKQYFLYRSQGDQIMCSPLPDWITQKSEYRQIACAILHHEGVLPKSNYIRNGRIVTLNIGYLFPPSIQNMIMLYSWPQNIRNSQGGFKRMMNIEIWEVLQSQLEALGYEFVEEH
jgi:hypothetical protein